jgi:hypothetical protein
MAILGSPFSRSQAIFAAIAALMGAGATRARAAELAGAATYKSRGKGKGRIQASANTTACQKRAAVKARNRAKHKAHCK